MLEGSFNTPLGNNFYTPSENGQTNEGLQVQLVKANEKIENLESQLNQAEGKIEEYELQIGNLGSKLVDAEEKIEELESKLSENEQTNEGLQVQLVEANEKIENLESQLNQAEGKIEEYELQIGNLGSKLVDAEEKIENLEPKLNQAEEKIEGYKLQFEDLNTEKKQLEKKLQDDKEVANRIADDRNKLQKQYELLLNRFINLTEEAENKNVDVAKYRSQLNDMREILTKQNNDLNNLANNNRDLHMRNMNFLQSQLKMQNQLDSLQGELVAKDMYHREQGETQEIEMEELKRQNDELKNQIAALQEGLKKKNDELKNQIAALQNGKNSDSLIDKIILDKEYKRTHLVIGISLAVVGLSLIISPFIIPSIFGMGGVIFGSAVLVSALLYAPALFYGNQNSDEKEPYKIGLDRKTIVKDGAFFKKVSGLVLGIGLILAGLLCLAFPHLALFYFWPQAITNMLYLVCAVFGAYLTSRFYAIKIPEIPQYQNEQPKYNNMYPLENQNGIYDPNLMQNNFGYNIPNNLYNDNKGQNRNYYMNPNGIDDQNLRNNDLNYNNAQNQFNDYKNDNNELPNQEEVDENNVQYLNKYNNVYPGPDYN